jgi:hypothetical protein
VSGIIGNIDADLDIDLKKIKSAMYNSIEAISSFALEMINDFANNTFGTDRKYSDENEFIMKKKRAE